MSHFSDEEHIGILICFDTIGETTFVGPIEQEFKPADILNFKPLRKSRIGTGRLGPANGNAGATSSVNSIAHSSRVIQARFSRF